MWIIKSNSVPCQVSMIDGFSCPSEALPPVWCLPCCHSPTKWHRTSTTALKTFNIIGLGILLMHLLIYGRQWYICSRWRSPNINYYDTNSAPLEILEKLQISLMSPVSFLNLSKCYQMLIAERQIRTRKADSGIPDKDFNEINKAWVRYLLLTKYPGRFPNII